MKVILLTLSAILFILTVHCDVQLDRLKLPTGWKIEQLATVPNARQMSINKDETVLFVGSKDAHNIYAVPLQYDSTSLKYTAGEIKVLKTNLVAPVGVAFDDETGDLYYSEVSQISKIKNVLNVMNQDTIQSEIVAQYPSEYQNGWKYIKINKDRLYIPQGTPCNRCLMDLPYSSITSINKNDGTSKKIHARGVRFSVGFDWHSTTGNLWFTDNGATKDEDFGDDKPGNELNELTEEGNHFGYPFCYEKDLVDPDFNNGTCSAYVPAKFVLAAHVAALGMQFYRAGKSKVPDEYVGDNLILIAEHGSVNRTKNVGYRITSVNISDPESYKVVIEGWMDKTTGKVWGRPVDVLVLSDGSYLISDDFAGVIYRVSYSSVATIKLWAYIAFPVLFFLALSAVGIGVFFFNKYQKAKASSTEQFQPMEEEEQT